MQSQYLVNLIAILWVNKKVLMTVSEYVVCWHKRDKTVSYGKHDLLSTECGGHSTKVSAAADAATWRRRRGGYTAGAAAAQSGMAQERRNPPLTHSTGSHEGAT